MPRLAESATFSIGVDLGGTNLRAAAMTPTGETLEEFSIPTKVGAGPERIVERIVEGVEEGREGHSGSKLIGVGVGAPALIRLETGVIAKAPNLPGWEEFPLQRELETRLGLPVILENDANAAALGEVWLGTGHDVNDMILLTLGTGIGGGIISEGKILHGYLGLAGELGHITVDANSSHVCACGNRGCIEAHGSGTAIRRVATAAAKAGQVPVLSELLGSHGELTPALVAQAAQQGCAEALRIYDDVGRALGWGLAGLVNVFNFPLYLLAGGILASWALFAPAMFEEVEARSLVYRSSDTRIEKATLGAKAGIYGAAYLPIQKYGSIVAQV